MLEVKLSTYNAMSKDKKGVWDTERHDWPEWDIIRDKYMGKRTILTVDGLMIEGLHFKII